MKQAQDGLGERERKASSASATATTKQTTRINIDNKKNSERQSMGTTNNRPSYDAREHQHINADRSSGEIKSERHRLRGSGGVSDSVRRSHSEETVGERQGKRDKERIKAKGWQAGENE